jgi:hypothetical protein
LPRFPLKFSVGKNLHAYEYFVRTRFAQQMFRRRIEFSDSLSAQREKQQRRFASADPRHSAKSCPYVVSQTDRDGPP